MDQQLEPHRLRQHPQRRRLLTMGFVLGLQSRTTEREDARIPSVLSHSVCASTLSLLFC